MILAYPINKEGNAIGGERSFSDEQWARMLKIPNLRWRVLPKIETVQVQTVDHSLQEMSKMENLNEMTKRELIDLYELPIEDMKLTKSQIIEKIT